MPNKDKTFFRDKQENDRRKNSHSPYDDIAQILQFRHLTHGATNGLDIVEQHEQQDDGADEFLGLYYLILKAKYCSIIRIKKAKVLKKLQKNSDYKKFRLSYIW